MTRLFLALALVAGAAAPAHAGEISGAWTAAVSENHPGRFELSLQTGGSGQSTSGFLVSGFTGLSTGQIESNTRTAVEFRLERDAGTFFFDGTFRGGRGGGDFRFVPDVKYPGRLHELGVPFDDAGKGEARRLCELALFDVSIDFIRSMQAIGYDENLDRLVEFRIFGVDPAYVRDMAGVGFRHPTGAKLVETKIHGATPDWIREMRAHGGDLTLDEYIETRIFQVTPEFVDEMAKAGYPNLSRERLVEFRIQGVTPEYIADLRTLGYTRLPASKLVEMRIQGVTPEFIRRVEKAGHHHVPVDRLVEMRIFHIPPGQAAALDEDAGR